MLNYSVLVVDDSIFHRRRLKEMIEQDDRLSVIETASNGKEALHKALTLHPDIITMDVEMPIMDGIMAVREIMQAAPTPILMFSSLTREGATQTFDALDAGALDFLLKEFDSQFTLNSKVGLRLRSKLLSLVRQRHPMRHMRKPRALAINAPKVFIKSEQSMSTPVKTSTVNIVNSVTKSGKRYQCLAIGASTGGPVALQQVLSTLPVHFPVPILLVQHMPATFTEAFAERLNHNCAIHVKLAEDNETLFPGVAYLAPGGRQMLVQGSRRAATLHITDIPDNGQIVYKPSVDHCFTSLANVFGGEVLSIILTGMGNDGTAGCRVLAQYGATVWAQDEASSIVYGMPGAVTKANLAKTNIPIEQIGHCINTEIL